MAEGATASAVLPAELPRLAGLLAEAGLPSAGIGEPQCRLWRIADGGDPLAAVAGVEFYGSDALLRSVLVMPSRRRRGLGRAIVAAALAQAARGGVRRIFLLTTTAAAFFASLGFKTIERRSVPSAIAATAEFATLCPASAVCMVKALAP